MVDLIRRFSEWAASHGWECRLRSTVVQYLPRSITDRYTRLPTDYLSFVGWVELVVASDDKAWFNCCEDYERETGFRWNQLELVSLKAAQDQADYQWLSRVKSFWAKHL